MSWGAAILVVVLAALLGLWVAGRMMARAARASEGRAVSELVGQTDDLVADDVVLWFHSPSCGPCKAMQPGVDPLVESGRARAIDVMQQPDIARAFSVMATPTTVVVRGGVVREVRTGFLSPKALESLAS